ncbi:MAG TPA: FAD-binding protein, partial [Acidimicrobiales bacterium]|nr:FAD-binding protein [Acidimicrobiales bacterium]
MATAHESAELTLIEALSRGLPADRLVVDPDVLAAISHDDAEWAPAGKAVAGVRARTEAEVQHVVRTCAELGAPVVPRGAGTGLSGGANAVSGCVILDLSRMNQVLEIDPDNLVCVVQPGAVNNDVKAAVAEHGLWYPPDPASAPWSTIGGNVATNAGGLCCLKYGVTRDYVLGLRAVVGGPVAYGDAVRLGRRTTKGVAGLDLVGLFVGSEGTLGVVTEVTLRLRPAPAGTPRTVVGAFPDLVSSGQAVAQITRRGLTPAVLELLDRACLEAVEEWKQLGIDADAAALLLARVDTPGDSGAAESAAIAAASAAPESPGVSTRASSSAAASASMPRCFHSSTASRQARSSSSRTAGVRPRRVIWATACPDETRSGKAPTTVRGVPAGAGRSRSVTSVTTPSVPSDPTNSPTRSSPAT